MFGPAKMIVGRPFGDGKQPGAEPLVGVKAVDALVNLEKRLLGQVLRVMSVAGQPEEVIENSLLEALEQKRKCFLGAGLALLGQLLRDEFPWFHESRADRVQF